MLVKHLVMIGNQIDDPNTYEIKGLEVSSKNDYLDVKVNVEYGTCYTEVCYSLFAYDYTTNSWSMVGGWQKDTNFKWKPDSNDRYALALYSADKHFDSYENSKGERKDIIDMHWHCTQLINILIRMKIQREKEKILILDM